jgi:hypothetical protein
VEPGWSSGWADEGSTTAFAVTLRRGGGTIVTTTDVPQLAVPTSELNALGSGPTEIEVVKQGILPSRPAMITLNA